ncbi:unnamed protein product [Laminaria digitata]
MEEVYHNNRKEKEDECRYSPTKTNDRLARDSEERTAELQHKRSNSIEQCEEEMGQTSSGAK